MPISLGDSSSYMKATARSITPRALGVLAAVVADATYIASYSGTGTCDVELGAWAGDQAAKLGPDQTSIITIPAGQNTLTIKGSTGTLSLVRLVETPAAGATISSTAIADAFGFLGAERLGRVLNKRIPAYTGGGVSIAVPRPAFLVPLAIMPDPAVRTDGVRYWTTLDISTLKASSVTNYYVDPLLGNDTTGDGTENLPWATLSKAYTVAGSATVNVYLKGNSDGSRTAYYNAEGFNGTFRASSVNLFAYTGHQPVLGGHKVYTWTPVDGYPGLYKATITGDTILRVVDVAKAPLDQEGLPVPATAATSISQAGDTPNSWFVASSVLYVRRQDGSIPDRNVVAGLNTGTGVRFGNANGITMYMQGIGVVAGNRGVLIQSSGTTQTITGLLKSCWVIGPGGDSADDSIQGDGGNLVLQNCIVAYGAKDNVNLHAKNSNIPYLVELDVISYGAGSNAANESCNGSTIHDGCPGIRVNGRYYGNRGSQIADINAGTRSWNVGCTVYNGLGDGVTAAFESDFGCLDDAVMGIQGCVSFGTLYSLFANTNATVFLTGNLFEGSSSLAATARVRNLTPEEFAYKGAARTTSATSVNGWMINVPDGTTVVIDALVSSRRTGGSAGVAGDSGCYSLKHAFKNIGGTLTALGSVTKVNYEDVAAHTADFSAGSSGRLAIACTGAADTNISWEIDAKVTLNEGGS